MIAQQTIREEFDDLFTVYWIVGVAIFVLICVLTIAFVLRFHHSRHAEAERRHTNMPVEISYIAIVAVITGFLVYLTFETMESPGYRATAQGDERPEADPDALVIDLTASRWNWRFAYPAQDVVVQGDGDDVPTLTVPEDRPVTLRMRSVDVIHAVWIPELRFKQDVFPGFTNTMTLTFPDAGFLREGGECNQFCGLRHAAMDFNVDVLTPADFERWAAREAA